MASCRTRILVRFKETMRIISTQIGSRAATDFVGGRGGYDVIQLGIGNDE